MTTPADDSGGLASAYQITQVTDGIGITLDTSGNLSVGVVSLPLVEFVPPIPAPTESSENHRETEPTQLPSRLALEMTENRVFRQLAERGLTELQQGRYRELHREKRKSGVV